MAEEGKKNDDAKLRYDLIPTYPLERLAEVYTIGSRKYQDRNWERGLKWGRVFAALMRHAWAWWRGEQLDKKDGQHHLSSVAWCAFALMEYEQTHRELDDRPVQPPVPQGCSGMSERKCLPIPDAYSDEAKATYGIVVRNSIPRASDGQRPGVRPLGNDSSEQNTPAGDNAPSECEPDGAETESPHLRYSSRNG